MHTYKWRPEVNTSFYHYPFYLYFYSVCAHDIVGRHEEDNFRVCSLHSTLTRFVINPSQQNWEASDFCLLGYSHCSDFIFLRQDSNLLLNPELANSAELIGLEVPMSTSPVLASQVYTAAVSFSNGNWGCEHRSSLLWGQKVMEPISPNPQPQFPCDASHVMLLIFRAV